MIPHRIMIQQPLPHIHPIRPLSPKPLRGVLHIEPNALTHRPRPVLTDQTTSLTSPHPTPRQHRQQIPTQRLSQPRIRNNHIPQILTKHPTRHQPDRRNPIPLLPNLTSIRVITPRHHPPEIRLMRPRRRKQKLRRRQLHHLHHREISLMAPPVIRIVQHQHITIMQIRPELGHQRLHRHQRPENMSRNRRLASHQQPIRTIEIRQPRRIIMQLLKQRMHRRALHHPRHRPRNRLKRIRNHLRRNHITRHTNHLQPATNEQGSAGERERAVT